MTAAATRATVAGTNSITLSRTADHLGFQLQVQINALNVGRKLSPARRWLRPRTFRLILEILRCFSGSQPP